MEDTLGASTASQVASSKRSLNPCFNGTVLAPLFLEGVGKAPNPCSNGRYSLSVIMEAPEKIYMS